MGEICVADHPPAYVQPLMDRRVRDDHVRPVLIISPGCVVAPRQ
jgi:hypothetical protein